MFKKISVVITMILLPAILYAGERWEKKGNSYFLAKSRENFALEGAGPNMFASRFLRYNGVDFLVSGPEEWKDYGRINLDKNNLFSIPIRQGARIDEIHLLCGGNYSNSYEHDDLMRLFGEKYFYATLSVIFIYEDGVYQELSVPVFWDWFSIGLGTWSGNGAVIKSLGENPVRRKCSIFHVTFSNPRPDKPVKGILLTDSWIDDRPFSDVFALTVRSSGALEPAEKAEK